MERTAHSPALECPELISAVTFRSSATQSGAFGLQSSRKAREANNFCGACALFTRCAICAIRPNVQILTFPDRPYVPQALDKDRVVSTLRKTSSPHSTFVLLHKNLARSTGTDRATKAFLATLLSSAIAASDAAAVMRQAQQSSSQEIWRQSLREAVEVLSEAKGDIDGDGQEELAICYRLPENMRDTLGIAGDVGGLALFTGDRRLDRPVFHTIFSDGTCRQLKLTRDTLQFVSPDPENRDKTTPYRWTYGRDFLYVGEDGHALAELQGQRREDSIPVQHLFDGRLDTAWTASEGSTGVGEKLRMRFPRPVRIGLVGIFGGMGASRLAHRAHNRLHRITMQAQNAQLSAPSPDDKQLRVAYALQDAPIVTYFVPPLAGLPIETLEVRVEGVYLGKTSNDTRVGELEIVPMMALRSGLGVAGGNFRTSRRMQSTGIAPPLPRSDAKDAGATSSPRDEGAAAPSASLFQTTNLKELKTLEAELDAHGDTFEMDEF